MATHPDDSGGMGLIASTLGASAHAAASQRVVIVGAGPSGLATAIELAQNGVRSTVLEARGEVANRETLFNVVPAFADRLQALDPSGGLTRLLSPTNVIDGRVYRRPEDLLAVRDATVLKEFTGPLAPDPSRSRGDMGAVTAALAADQSADTRMWSKVGIGDLDNALRTYVRDTPELRELIDIRYDTPVASLRQGDGWAEAVLKDGAAGTSEAVRGAMLVDASGKNLLGSPFEIYPEQSFWIGSRSGPTADARAGAALPISRAYLPGATRGDRTVVVALPSGDRTVTWTETTRDGLALSDAAALQLVAERARLAGISEPLVDGAQPWRLSVQLANTTQAADGRVLAMGNSVRSPYFMTSTGAASAFVHDAPQAVDAILAVLRGGADPAGVSAQYNAAVLDANAELFAPVRKMFLQDLGVRTANAGAAQIAAWPARG